MDAFSDPLGWNKMSGEVSSIEGVKIIGGELSTADIIRTIVAEQPQFVIIDSLSAFLSLNDGSASRILHSVSSLSGLYHALNVLVRLLCCFTGIFIKRTKSTQWSTWHRTSFR